MRTIVIGCALAVACMASACNRDRADDSRQTKFPGMVTAGGATSGEVMAAAKKATDASYAGGTPGTAGGMEGNTGGAKMGGTVAESGHAPTGTAPPAAKQTPSGQ